MILARKKQSFIRRYYILIALFIIVLIWSLLFAYQQYLQFQTQRRTAITSINGIHCLQKVFLGGTDQWILIRGTDRSNPVLLFLHGGPGAPLFCFSRKIGYETGLEQNFVMVYWEQRGAGKSFSLTIPEESMNIEQFISDTYELSVYLKKKFQVEKIFLLARSWGSLIGILAVKQHPELFHAYVGIGQLVHPLKNDSISYHHTLRLAPARQALNLRIM